MARIAEQADLAAGAGFGNANGGWDFVGIQSELAFNRFYGMVGCSSTLMNQYAYSALNGAVLVALPTQEPRDYMSGNQTISSSLHNRCARATVSHEIQAGQTKHQTEKSLDCYWGCSNQLTVNVR
jgi:hypothetical protein